MCPLSVSLLCPSFVNPMSLLCLSSFSIPEAIQAKLVQVNVCRALVSKTRFKESAEFRQGLESHCDELFNYSYDPRYDYQKKYRYGGNQQQG